MHASCPFSNSHLRSRAVAIHRLCIDHVLLYRHSTSSPSNVSQKRPYKGKRYTMRLHLTSPLGQLATSLLLPPVMSASLLSSGHGVSGLGLALFTPSCCYSCLNSFWALSLPCSSTQLNQTFAVDSPRCLASNGMYLESLAWCMRMKCPSEGINDAQVDSV